MSFRRHENQISIVLGQCATSVKLAGRGRWEFTLANGKSLGVTARLSDEWLMLDAPVSERIAYGGRWDLLRLNAGIRGLSRFALMKQVRLRADIPLAEDEDDAAICDASSGLTVRLLETCAELKAAFGGFLGEKPGDHGAAVRDRFEQPGEQRFEELRRLCSDTSWPFTERSAGKLMIDLDARSAFYQACVEQREAGISVSVEILQPNVLSETCRQALGLLLLGTSAQVKLARPSVEENQDRINVRFEVRFATTPTADELAHSFSGLSVACDTAAREAQALQDESIARDYLSSRLPPEPALATMASD